MQRFKFAHQPDQHSIYNSNSFWDILDFLQIFLEEQMINVKAIGISFTFKTGKGVTTNCQKASVDSEHGGILVVKM